MEKSLETSNNYEIDDHFAFFNTSCGLEKNIIGWLEEKNICMTDPLQKKDAFYETNRKKIESFRTLKAINPTILENSTNDTDLSMNSIISLKKQKLHKGSTFEDKSGENFLKDSTMWKIKNRRQTAPPKESDLKSLLE